jgi:HSP20 family protein
MFGLIPRREREKVGYAVPRLRDEFKALYNRFFNGWPMLFEPYPQWEHFWGFEVKDVEKEVIVRAEIPGFEAEELNVELRNNRLFIKAGKKRGEKEKDYEYTERRYERVVELPFGIDPAKVEAIYRNGVLEVHLPKMEEAMGRCIPVK